MTFTEQQVAQLDAKLDGSKVRERDGFSYIEGWWAIHEANRIFGHGEWDSEVVDLKCVISTQQGQPNYEGRENRAGYIVGYIASVKVTVRHGDSTQSHEDVGYGEGINYSNVGQAHESAAKEAVTDALKRALHNWGNPFGLSLYDKAQADVERAPVDQGYGICPLHDEPFFQKGRMREPAHKLGDGWCNVSDVEHEQQARQIAQPAKREKSDAEIEATELLSERFHGEKVLIRSYVIEVIGRDVLPSQLTEKEWGLLRDALVSDQLDAAAPEDDDFITYADEPKQGEL